MCPSGKIILLVALVTVFILKGAVAMWLQSPFTNSCETSLVLPFPWYIQFSCSRLTHITVIFISQHRRAVNLTQAHLPSRLLAARSPAPVCARKRQLRGCNLRLQHPLVPHNICVIPNRMRLEGSVMSLQHTFFFLFLF